MAPIPVQVGHVGGFEGRGHALFVITLVFTIAAASLVAVRMGARISMKATGRDDYTILASLVSSLCSRLKKLSGRTNNHQPPCFLPVTCELRADHTTLALFCWYGSGDLCWSVLHIPIL